MKKYLLTFLLIISINQLFAQCTVSLIGVTNSGCDNQSGQITLQADSGTAPYTFYFPTNTNSTSGLYTLASLTAGVYSFFTIDASGDTCSGATTATVLPISANPLSATYSVTYPSCFTCNDGSISPSVFGGSPPYSYSWSNGVTTPTASNLLSGIYIFYAVDGNGCMVTDTINLYPGHHSITGTVYWDLNGNGLIDSTDIGLNGQQILLTPSMQIAYTNQNGNYLLNDTIGNYTIEYSAIGNFSIAGGPVSYNIVLNSDTTGFDFLIMPDTFYHEMTSSITAPLTRCNLVGGIITSFQNIGTYLDSFTVELTLDTNLVYNYSYPAGTVNGQTITYSFANLVPGQTINIQTSCLFPAAGSVFEINGVVNQFDTAGVIVNQNILHFTNTVRCSYDPNDKSAFPLGVGVDSAVVMDQELLYQIRFQNTGNDTAFNVFVMDTLDAGLNPQSMQLVGTSHPCTVERMNNNILKFNFDNILLPDSNIDEASSHGYILFRISGSSSNVDPTPVNNTAYIYFDQNAPVVTNTTMRTFSNNLVSGIRDVKRSIDFSIQPMPVTDHARVIINSNETGNHEILIYDLLGKKNFIADKFVGIEYLLNTEKLSKGVYIVQITNVKTSESGNLKLIKQ